jgi:hypothetical protein
LAFAALFVSSKSTHAHPNLTTLVASPPLNSPEIVFLFISSFIGTIAVACVRQHESSTRASFLRLQAEDSVQKVLYTVLHRILPDRAIDQIADCARANAPLVASAESFLDTAVIFIRVNLEEAASRTAKQKVRKLLAFLKLHFGRVSLKVGLSLGFRV